MKANEFLLVRDNVPVSCYALSVLYSEDSNRSFVAYYDGTLENGKPVLKYGEISTDGDDVIIEDITNKEELDDIHSQFIEIYKKAINDYENS